MIGYDPKSWISLSDPYSTSIPYQMPKQLKRPQACRGKTSYFLILSRSTINGEWASFKQAAKKRHSFETIACNLQLTSCWMFTTTSSRVAKDSDQFYLWTQHPHFSFPTIWTEELRVLWTSLVENQLGHWNLSRTSRIRKGGAGACSAPASNTFPRHGRLKLRTP